jgi:pyruvate,water dikinase
MVNAILKEGFQLSGFKLQPGVQRAGLFHGRLYINLSLLQWEGYASVGIRPEAMNRLIGGHQPSIKVSTGKRQRLSQLINLLRYLLKSPAKLRAGRHEVNQVMEQVVRWKRQPLPLCDEDFTRVLAQFTQFSSSVYNLYFLQGSASSALSFLVDTIDARLPGQGHSLAAALMAGRPASVTAQMGYDLVTMAKQAVADPFTRQWLEHRRNDEGNWQDLPKTNPLRQAFGTFLQRYGHRGIYETYTRNPRWHEQPDYLLDSLLELAKTDLQAQQRAQREARVNARRQVKRALPWWKRPLLDGMVRAAKRGSNEREAARSAMIAMLDPLRQVLLALGERWVEVGWLEIRDEIFYLLKHEIIAVLAKALPGEALAPRIADRRRQFETWQAEEAADVIVQHPDGSYSEASEEGVPPLTDGDCFSGIPVGAGRAVGLARILRSPDEGERLEPQEILVVPSTDPAWTPLFLKIGGLVMETGGYLSHGAIVAREFGIPAVVNLPGILRQLRDGDRVEVDGDKGRVRKQVT